MGKAKQYALQVFLMNFVCRDSLNFRLSLYSLVPNTLIFGVFTYIMAFRRKVLSVKRSRPIEEKQDEKTKAATNISVESLHDDASATQNEGGLLRSRTAPMYSPHLSSDEMHRGLAVGKLFSGKIRTSKSNCFYGHVGITLSQKEIEKYKANAPPEIREILEPFDTKVTMKIVLDSSEAVNRSFNGDTVCVEIRFEASDSGTTLPANETTQEMEEMINEDFENEAKEFYEAHAENQVSTSEKIVEGIECRKNNSSSQKREKCIDPYIVLKGRVRGILARGRRSFCGSLIGVGVAEEKTEPESEIQAKKIKQAKRTHHVFDPRDLPVSTYENFRAFHGAGTRDEFATGNMFFFQPYNPAFPRMRIYLTRSVLNSMPMELLFKTRFLVRVTDWEIGSTFPSANVTTAIGEEGNIDVEEKVVLFENDIIDSVNISTHENNNYACDEVQRIVENYYKEIEAADAFTGGSRTKSYAESFAPFFQPESDKPSRIDLRHLTIFSIDPEGCKDIDDALHCMQVDKNRIRSEILESPENMFTPNDRLIAQNIVDATETVYFAGIHIADVAHYVKENSKLDIEARRRGTSVYLVNKRINMLPSTLSEYLCSLQANEDRFCFSVMFFITESGEIITSDPLKRDTMQSLEINMSGVCVSKTVIKSCKEFSYERAHEVLAHEYGLTDAKELTIDPYGLDPLIRSSLVGLHSISVSLRKLRAQSGAVFLSSPEFRFVFSDSGNDYHPTKMINSAASVPSQLGSQVSIDTHSLIEEFMLLANSVVARVMLAFYPSYALLRNHMPPLAAKKDEQKTTNSMFDLMNKELAGKQARIEHALRGQDNPQKVHLHIDVSNSFTLNASLCESQDPLDKDFNHFLKLLVTRTMSRAQYIESDGKVSASAGSSPYLHYGLALPCYTHFTSPIRRYADLIVHRLLGSIFGYNEKPSFMIADECLDQNLLAEHVGFDSAAEAKASSTYATLTSLTAHLNAQHEKAQTAGRDSQKFFCRLYLIGLPDLLGQAMSEPTQEKLVLEKLKGYVIRKGHSKHKPGSEEEDIVVMIPSINIEGELAETKKSCEFKTHSLNLFDQVEVDVWIVEGQSSKAASKKAGPEIEIRFHEC